MHYVGLDVHARQSTYCVLDGNGRKLRTHTVRGPWSKVMTELSSVKRPLALCFEATNGYGYLYEHLSKLARRVVVAHPGQLRLIFRSKRKNDRIDAERLAKLLYLDEVPPVYVPCGQVRSWRRMIRLRSRLVAQRTRAKCRARALLRSRGIEAPRSLWSGKGTRWLRQVEFESDFDALSRDILLEELESVTQQIRRLERVLDQTGGRHPGVQTLRTAPGVGARTAEAVVAYIDNPDRFSRNEAVGSYFGLVPCQDASAERERLGHITRQGPPEVRRLLVEAAWQGVRRSRRLKRFYERICGPGAERKKIAIVATAHLLVRCLHAMLRDNRPWSEDLRCEQEWIIEKEYQVR